MATMTTCLWFKGDAEAAAEFYLSVFKDGRQLGISHYPEKTDHPHGQKGGSVLAVWFEILGRSFIAMNAQRAFEFNEAISITIECDTQSEIDYYWDRLTSGGKEIQCGWLKDKFGITWQVTPKVLGKMMCDVDPVRVARIMDTFGPMKKMDLATIEKAYNQK